MKTVYKKIIAIILLNLIALTSFSQLTNAFRFKITGSGYSDETVIRLLNGASVNFDGSYDAWKFFSPNINVPSLYTETSTGQELAINALPEFTKDTSITIYTNIPVSGTYTFDIEELFPLASNYKVSVTDINSNTHYRIIGDTSFVFAFHAQQNSPTFTFNISTLTNSTLINETCYEMNDGELIINNEGSPNSDIVVLDSNNNVITNNSLNTSVNNFQNLAPGNYSAKVTSKGILDEINFSITAAPKLLADFSIDKDTAYLSDGGIINFTNNSQFAQNYNWDFNDGITTSSVSPSHSYTTVGNYNITLSAQNTNCLTQKNKQITILSSPSITTSVKENSVNKLKILNQGNGNFKLLSSTYSNKQINVYDITGKAIINQTYSANEYNLSLTNYNSGIYIITIIGENGLAIQEKIYR